MLNQNPSDLGIPNQFSLTPSRSRHRSIPHSLRWNAAADHPFFVRNPTKVEARSLLSLGGLPEGHLDDFAVTAVCALERAQIVARFVGRLDVLKYCKCAAFRALRSMLHDLIALAGFRLGHDPPPRAPWVTEPNCTLPNIRVECRKTHLGRP